MTTTTLERPQVVTTNQDILNGIELLDEVRPGWVDEIDLDRLNMYQGQDCVVGQLYGGYATGLEQLGLSNGAAHGFVEPTNQWVSAIERLRGE